MAGHGKAQTSSSEVKGVLHELLTSITSKKRAIKSGHDQDSNQSIKCSSGNANDAGNQISEWRRLSCFIPDSSWSEKPTVKHVRLLTYSVGGAILSRINCNPLGTGPTAKMSSDTEMRNDWEKRDVRAWLLTTFEVIT